MGLGDEGLVLPGDGRPDHGLVPSGAELLEGDDAQVIAPGPHPLADHRGLGDPAAVLSTQPGDALLVGAQGMGALPAYGIEEECDLRGVAGKERALRGIGAVRDRINSGCVVSALAHLIECRLQEPIAHGVARMEGHGVVEVR